MAGHVSDDVTERRKSRRRPDQEVHSTSPWEVQQRTKQAGCRGYKDGGVRLKTDVFRSSMWLQDP